MPFICYAYGGAVERNGYLYMISQPSTTVVMDLYAKMYGRATSKNTERVWYCSDNYWMDNGLRVLLKDLDVSYDLSYGGAKILYATGQSLSTISKFQVPGLQKVVLGHENTESHSGVDCRILAKAFAGYSSKLETIILNEPIVSIGDNAFDGLKSGGIICNKKTPPELSQNAFNEMAFNNVIVAVPDESYNLYISSDWNKFKNVVKKSDTSLSFSISSIKMNEGETFDLATYEGVTNTKLHWSSSNSEIVEVQDGVLRAKKAGTAKITATNFFENGASCEVIVEKPVSDLNILDTEDIVNSTLQLLTGKNYELENIKVLITPNDASDKSLTWHIENENIATIENGEICPKQPGETVLKVTAKSGVYAEIKIVVSIDLIISQNIIYKVISETDKTSKVLRPTSKDLVSAKILSEVHIGGIGYSVIEIADSAFYSCKDLISLDIPNSVSNIGKTAFKQCESLQSIKIPQGVSTIKANTFYACTSLSSVELPASLLIIGQFAFAFCSDLTSITIPKSVTKLDTFAFWDCNLTSLLIPNSVISIGNGAFDDNNLQSLTIEDGEGSLHLLSSCFYHNKIENLYVGRDITNWNFLHNNSYLKSVELGNFVTEIGSSAFRDCTGLTSITIPNSVNSIGYSAFDGCIGLTSITIPNSVNSIGASAFDGCNLNSVICFAEDPPKMQLNTFPAQDQTNLYVLQNSLAAYKSSLYWRHFRTILPIQDIIIEADGVATPTSGITLKASETIQLTATVLSETTSDKSVTWKSNDENIATVDANGKVTAVAVGKATITATAASGVSAECAITVIETPAIGIAIDKDALGITGDNVEMKVGESKSIQVTVFPGTATDKSVTFESVNPEVANVDENGNVIALSVGTTTITITANSNPTVKATLNVTVLPPLALSIELEPTSIESVVGNEVQLVAKILPEQASDQTLEWNSSNSEVAIVSSNGLVKILKEGTAVIEVRTTDGSNLTATCNVSAMSSIESILADVDTGGADIYNLQGFCLKHNASLSDIKTL